MGKIQFRLTTLFWLMACVACFFGGHYWHVAGRSWKQMTSPPADHKIKILAGRSVVVRSPWRVTWTVADDTAIATVAPVTQNTFAVAAHSAGTTKVQTWGPTPSETTTWAIVVVSPYPP